MNNEPSKLHEILERATAAGDDLPADLDAETAMLRNGWLHFCKLIEDDSASCNGAADGERGAQRTGDDKSVDGNRFEKNAETIVEIAQPREHRKPLGWSRWFVAATAASVLLVAGAALAIRLLNQSNEPQRNPLQPEPQQMARNENMAKHSTDPGSAPIPVPAPADRSVQQTVPTADRLPWGDAVDDEIKAVGQATMIAQQDWYAQSSAVGAVQTGVNEMEKELDQGPL